MTRSTEECEMSRSCQSGNVFKGCLGIAAQYARQAADLLAGDGVLLVRHGRGALLLLAEVLLRLAHFGPLQMADLDGDLVERAADNGQRRNVRCVPVALDHLRRHRRRLQTQPRADALFVFWLKMAECSDGARELAYAHVFGRGVKAGQIPLHLGVPVEQLQAKGCGLGMNAMRAPDRRRVLELEGAALEHGQKASRPVRIIADASFTCKACAVSTMSFEVSP